MAARFGSPLLVWIGAVAAMATKGALAASIGAGVRQWIAARIPPKVVRYAGVSALLVLGLLSVLETLDRGSRLTFQAAFSASIPRSRKNITAAPNCAAIPNATKRQQRSRVKQTHRHAAEKPHHSVNSVERAKRAAPLIH